LRTPRSLPPFQRNAAISSRGSDDFSGPISRTIGRSADSSVTLAIDIISSLLAAQKAGRLAKTLKEYTRPELLIINELSWRAWMRSLGKSTDRPCLVLTRRDGGWKTRRRGWRKPSGRSVLKAMLISRGDSFLLANVIASCGNVNNVNWNSPGREKRRLKSGSSNEKRARREKNGKGKKHFSPGPTTGKHGSGKRCGPKVNLTRSCTTPSHGWCMERAMSFMRSCGSLSWWF